MPPRKNRSQLLLDMVMDVTDMQQLLKIMNARNCRRNAVQTALHRKLALLRRLCPRSRLHGGKRCSICSIH